MLHYQLVKQSKDGKTYVADIGTESDIYTSDVVYVGEGLSGDKYYLVKDKDLNGYCCDCGEEYELDALDLDLRCADCVEQWKLEEANV